MIQISAYADDADPSAGDTAPLREKEKSRGYLLNNITFFPETFTL